MIKKGNNSAFLVMMIALFFLLAGCGTQQNVEEADEEANDEIVEIEHSEDNPTVKILMEDGGEILLELFPEIAPNTVANFISLIEDDFYDGVVFHRVIPGFMIQGGDPNGDGSGGPGYSIEGEFSSNGFDNPLRHDRGVLSMARTPDPNSAGSQFFIMVEDSPHLDGDYAAFGRVVEGMDVVDRIVAAERDGRDKPLEDQTMQSVTVDTKGKQYPKPEVE